MILWLYFTCDPKFVKHLGSRHVSPLKPLKRSEGSSNSNVFKLPKSDQKSSQSLMPNPTRNPSWHSVEALLVVEPYWASARWSEASKRRCKGKWHRLWCPVVPNGHIWPHLLVLLLAQVLLGCLGAEISVSVDFRKPFPKHQILQTSRG